MKFLYSLMAKLFGKNFSFTPKDVIIDQMTEPRALPMGKTEFELWADRIISGALLPTDHLWKLVEEESKEGITSAVALDMLFQQKVNIFYESLKFALANMLLHLGPTESHKPDAFFIHSLRKVAVNQVADTVRVEIRDTMKKRLEQEEKKPGDVGGQTQAASEVLV